MFKTAVSFLPASQSKKPSDFQRFFCNIIVFLLVLPASKRNKSSNCQRYFSYIPVSFLPASQSKKPSNFKRYLYNIIVSLLGLPASQSKKPSHFQQYFSNIAVSLLQASQSCLLTYSSMFLSIYCVWLVNFHFKSTKFMHNCNSKSLFCTVMFI